jgi:hypothetical protein
MTLACIIKLETIIIDDPSLSSITIVSDAPNCSVTYDHHYDDRNRFIIQATTDMFNSQVAASFPYMFQKIYLGKNKKIGNNSIMTEARGKISADLESLEFTELKKQLNILIKISH